MKILVIGCGSIGERHIKNIKSLASAEAIACEQDDRRLEYIKENYKIKAFNDYEKALADEAIDAALVCTTTSNHIAPALAAIKHGSHVFIEKPMSHNLEGVDALIKEARDRKLILMTAFNYRFHPDLRHIKNLLDTGALGRPVSARMHFGSNFQYRVPFHNGQDYRQDYAAQKIGGGVILDAATHFIDSMMWFFNDVEEVFCYSGTMGNLDLKAEDFAELLLKFKRGTIASIHTDFIQQPFQLKCEIIGEAGTITWDGAERKVMLFPAASNRWQEIEVENKSSDMYLEEIKHFIQCIKGEETPAADRAAGRRVLEIALAVKKSAAAGRAIKV
ncbi:MAG: Gfo/Idh/MocA family oxidoreductase [Dehalococcoidales bacterium]|nr:Gfo/Idh/MocA family oxidoreductase [Dehalococcoidales bacterium]